ncbi:MAG: hypothetical protein JSU98_11365 [Gemmatimonadales bacterium]|nr:MAG: hypothetical protein JSU98_11365 [Gemmatimonadales bacterium]
MTPLSSPEALRIDVAGLARRSVASLYSHLVTRPTGRAVRLAIESQLAEAGEPSISLVDFSQVTILDFSCADEVVARLLRRYMPDDRPRDAFFVFRGVQEWHEEPIQVVLERQSLAAVAQVADGQLRLLGTVAPEEVRLWRRVEEARSLSPDSRNGGGLALEDLAVLGRLISRRLVFQEPEGPLHALTHLLGEL